MVAGLGDRVTPRRIRGAGDAGLDDSKWRPRRGPVGSAYQDAPSRWMPSRADPGHGGDAFRSRACAAPWDHGSRRLPREGASRCPRGRKRPCSSTRPSDHRVPELTPTGARGQSPALCGGAPQSGTKVKGNRDDVEGKELRGARDVFIADGGPARSGLWWRTYRYVQLEVDGRGAADDRRPSRRRHLILHARARRRASWS